MPVYGGIDTNSDTHHVAVIDAHGRQLGDVQIPATPAPYQTAVQFPESWTGLAGVECTGSYGAAVTREIGGAASSVAAASSAPNLSSRVSGE